MSGSAPALVAGADDDDDDDEDVDGVPLDEAPGGAAATAGGKAPGSVTRPGTGGIGPGKGLAAPVSTSMSAGGERCTGDCVLLYS